MGGWWAKFKVAGARGLWEGELEDGESDGCGREVGPGRLQEGWCGQQPRPGWIKPAEPRFYCFLPGSN